MSTIRKHARLVIGLAFAALFGGATFCVASDIVFREEFTGTSTGLLSKGWWWIRKNSLAGLASGSLYITTLERGSFEPGSVAYNNFLYRRAPHLIDFSVETYTSTSLRSRLSQSDLMLYTTDADYVRFGLRLDPDFQLQVFHVHRVGGVLVSESVTPHPGTRVYLRIRRVGTSAILEYSDDGTGWLTQYTIPDLQFTPLYTGLIAFIEPGFPLSSSTSLATFDYFVMRGAERTLTIQPLDPTEVVGASGPIPPLPTACQHANPLITECAGPVRPSTLPATAPCALTEDRRRYLLTFTLRTQPGNLPIGGAPVAVAVRAEEKSGCHGHSDSDRLAGCLGVDCAQSSTPSATGVTNAQGQFTVEYTAPELAGIQNLVFYPTTSGYPFYYSTVPGTQFYAPQDTFVSVCVLSPGLEDLPESPGRYVKAAVQSHETAASYFTTPGMQSALEGVSDDWNGAVPGGPRLQFNSISLPWGGLFDTKRDWRTPHCGHRTGLHADMQIRGVVAAETRAKLKELVNKRNLGILVHCSEGATPEMTHWHLSLDGQNSEPTCLPILSAGFVASRTQSLDVDVQCAVTYLPESSAYQYRYTVANLTGSTGKVQTFALSPVGDLLASTAPEHWSGTFGYAGDSLMFAWNLTDTGPPASGWVDLGYNLYESSYLPAPGDSVAGIVLVSGLPPDSVTFFVDSWSDVPLGTSAPGGVLAGALTGRTLGPKRSATTGVVSEPKGGRAPAGVTIQSASYRVGRQVLRVTGSCLQLGELQVDVFDVAGRKLLQHRASSAGRDRYDIELPVGGHLATGVYLVRIRQGGASASIRTILLH